MRVLVATGLYPPEIGGPATYAKLLEDGLPGEGIEVVVVTFRDARSYPKLVRHLVYFWMVFRASRSADCIFALDPMSVGVPALLAAIVRRKRFVLKVVGDYAWEQATQRFGFAGTLEEFQSAEVSLIAHAFRSTERFVARNAERIIVPSQYLANIVLTWGVHEQVVVVIPNGVSVGDVGKKETIRGVLHFSGHLLMSVGRLVPWKGFDVLINVFATLCKKYPDLTLMIVGTGPLLESLQSTVNRLQLSEKVIFAGSVDHDALLRYLKAADVFVLNTSYEGLSHLILETMAVGTPVVTTAVGGNPEVIADGVSGYLVQPDDARALTSRIEKLLDDATLHERIVRGARGRVAEFTEARTLHRTAVLLKTICAS